MPTSPRAKNGKNIGRNQQKIKKTSAQHVQRGSTQSERVVCLIWSRERALVGQISARSDLNLHLNSCNIDPWIPIYYQDTLLPTTQQLFRIPSGKYQSFPDRVPGSSKTKIAFLSSFSSIFGFQ